MKFTTLKSIFDDQKIIAVVFIALILIVLGVMIFISDKSADHTTVASKAMPIITTSTAINNLNSTGWWNSIPTAKSLPVIPGINQSATPSSSTSQP